MRGPINFVYTVIWFAIGLATLGTLKDCTRVMMGYAIEANQNQMSLGAWNRELLKPHDKNK